MIFLLYYLIYMNKYNLIDTLSINLNSKNENDKKTLKYIEN